MTIEDTRRRRSAAGRVGAMAMHAKRPTGRGSLAARWAHLHGETLTAGAREFGVSIKTVSGAWKRCYPGVSATVSRRQHSGWHPEDELSL